MTSGSQENSLICKQQPLVKVKRRLNSKVTKRAALPIIWHQNFSPTKVCTASNLTAGPSAVFCMKWPQADLPLPPKVSMNWLPRSRTHRCKTLRVSLWSLMTCSADCLKRTLWRGSHGSTSESTHSGQRRSTSASCQDNQHLTLTYKVAGSILMSTLTCSPNKATLSLTSSISSSLNASTHSACRKKSWRTSRRTTPTTRSKKRPARKTLTLNWFQRTSN